MRGEIDSLPRWARKEILLLRNQLKSCQNTLTECFSKDKDSNVFIRLPNGLNEEVSLPKNSVVIFRTECGKFEIVPDTKEIKVYSTDGRFLNLLVLPRGANSISLRGE